MTPSLKLHRLKIDVICHEKGQTVTEKFGTDLKFSDGINVIHAANTMGKSTCINAIIYALGLEMILGRKGSLSLTDALWGKLKHEGKEYEIDKSSVSLDVSNREKEKITIVRTITDPEIDNRIVKVLKENNQPSLYYVNDPGAAQSDKGFYKYLTKFIGWQLPTVSTYEGNKVPLYIECIFPLFFVEQKRGWSKLQANIPTAFGIRHAAEQAIQFLLNLDFARLSRERDILKFDIERAKAEWTMFVNETELLARNIGGVLQNMPVKPPLRSEEFSPNLAFSLDGQIVTTELWIESTKRHIESLQTSIDHVEYNSASVEADVKQTDMEIIEREKIIEQIRNEYSLERRNLELIEKRIEHIAYDIKKNGETLKIQKYAKQIDQEMVLEQCPTCGQEMKNTLMPASFGEEPMSIEDNIVFLKEQQISAMLLRKQAIKNKDALYAKFQEAENELNIQRKKVRDIRSELRQDVKIPKLSQVRELAKRQEDLEKVQSSLKLFDAVIENCKEFIPKYEEMYLRYKEIDKEGFSEKDLRKLEQLKDSLRKSLSAFHFRTREPSQVDVSLDNYQPVSDGIDLSQNASASDNIRMIFAYTLSLLDVSNQEHGNHPGLIIYDEMRQQDIDVFDLRNAYLRMQEIHLRDNSQFLVTSSSSPAHFKEITEGVPCNIIEVTGQLIAPLVSK